MIRRAIAQAFGREPLINLNPDEVVAIGAAIQANQLAGNDANGELLLLDVIPLSLGIETMGGLVERIVPTPVYVDERRCSRPPVEVLVAAADREICVPRVEVDRHSPG